MVVTGGSPGSRRRSHRRNTSRRRADVLVPWRRDALGYAAFPAAAEVRPDVIAFSSIPVDAAVDQPTP
jgi:hypothetical protein